MKTRIPVIDSNRNRSKKKREEQEVQNILTLKSGGKGCKNLIKQNHI